MKVMMLYSEPRHGFRLIQCTDTSSPFRRFKWRPSEEHHYIILGSFLPLKDDSNEDDGALLLF